jgi:hypothetical protein
MTMTVRMGTTMVMTLSSDHGARYPFRKPRSFVVRVDAGYPGAAHSAFVDGRGVWWSPPR